MIICSPKSRDMKLGHAPQQSWPALSFFLCLANGLLWLRGAIWFAKRSELLEQVHWPDKDRNSGNSRNHQRQHHRSSTSSIINHHLLHHIIRCLATTKQAIVERMLFINNEDFPDSQVRLTVSIGWGLLNSIINRCFFPFGISPSMMIEKTTRDSTMFYTLSRGNWAPNSSPFSDLITIATAPIAKSSPKKSGMNSFEHYSKWWSKETPRKNKSRKPLSESPYESKKTNDKSM